MRLLTRSLVFVVMSSCAMESGPSEPDPLGLREIEPDRGALAKEPMAKLPMPALARERIETSALPVLVPADAELLASLVVTTGPNWVGAAMQGDGVRLYVHGTSLRAHPKVPLGAPEAEATRVSIAEGIPTATFHRFGLAYSVEVSCAAPTTDTRCMEQGYVRRLVASLRLVGGGR